MRKLLIRGVCQAEILALLCATLPPPWSMAPAWGGEAGPERADPVAAAAARGRELGLEASSAAGAALSGSGSAGSGAVGAGSGSSSGTDPLEGYFRDFTRDQGNFCPGGVCQVPQADLTDEQGLLDLARQRRRELARSAGGTGEGASAGEAADLAGGGAWEVMIQSRRARPEHDLRQDPLLRRQADRIFSGEDQESMSALLGDCRKIPGTESITRTYHVPDRRTCWRFAARSGQCVLKHSLYAEEILSLRDSGITGLDNSLNITPCPGETNCLLLFAGREYKDNHGRCLPYPDRIRVAVLHPEAIREVSLSEAAWDDFWGSWITGADGIRHPLHLPTAELPVYITSVDETANPEAAGWIRRQGWAVVDRLNGDAVMNSVDCENTWHGGENCRGGGRCNDGYDPGIRSTEDGFSLTEIFRSTPAGEVVTLDSLTSTEDDGRYRMQIRIRLDPSRLPLRDEWAPADCLELARELDDGAAAGSAECTEELPGLVADPSGASYLISAGQVIYPALLNAPIRSITPFCARAAVSAASVFGEGTGNCGELEGRCGFLTSRCADEGSGGNCYSYEEEYDCGEDLTDQEVYPTASYECGGGIRCLGEECARELKTVSTSFARVSALLQAASFMGQDLNCTGLDSQGRPTGQEDVICRIFAGEHRSCTRSMKGAGGLEVDCCDCPAGVSLAQYLRGLLLVSRLDGIIAGMDHASLVYGAYSELRRPVFNGLAEAGNYLEQVTRPFTSWFENVTGMKGLFSGDQSVVEYVRDKLKDKAREVLREILGEARDRLGAEGAAAGGTAGEAGGQAGEAASDAIVEGASSALAVVGYVYMIYQISCMISSMLFRCDASQLQLAAQRSLKNCSYVGEYCSRKALKICVSRTYSYCCYSSPLSRIIQEQIHEQLGTPLSAMDPRSPDCSGISPEDLGRVDWDRISLDEWTGLLKLTGNYASDRELDPDGLTGAGTDLDLDYTDSEIGDQERSGVVERTLERVFDLDFDQIRREADGTYRVDTGEE